MLTINGTSRTNCSGVTRRELLQIGGAGLFGMTLPGVLAAQEAQQAFAGGKGEVGDLFVPVWRTEPA
jgi:hypothetical protein